MKTLKWVCWKVWLCQESFFLSILENALNCLLLFMWLNCLSLRPFSLCIASQTSVNTILYVQFSVFKGQFPCLEYQIISLLSSFRYTLVDHLCFHNVLSYIALTFFMLLRDDIQSYKEVKRALK